MMRYLDTFIPISNALEPFSVSHCYDKIERESSRLRRRKMQKKKRKGKKCSVSGTIGRTCEFRGSEEASRG